MASHELACRTTISPSTTVGDVKNTVARCAGVPIRMQQLFVGSGVQELLDSAELGTIGLGAEPILLVSNNNPIRRLQGDDKGHKIHAAREICRATPDEIAAFDYKHYKHSDLMLWLVPGLDSACPEVVSATIDAVHRLLKIGEPYTECFRDLDGVQALIEVRGQRAYDRDSDGEMIEDFEPKNGGPAWRKASRKAEHVMDTYFPDWEDCGDGPEGPQSGSDC